MHAQTRSLADANSTLIQSLRALDEPKRQRHSFVALCMTGYHFCKTCERITTPHGEIHRTCGWPDCGGKHIQWNPPILNTHTK